MGKMKLIDQFVRAAAIDAANRNMKKEHRTSWSKEDYNIAVREYDRATSCIISPKKSGCKTLNTRINKMCKNNPGCCRDYKRARHK